MGCVYFFKHNNMKYVKIGMTSKETPIDRFNDFLTYAPMGGEILGYFKTYTPSYHEGLIHEELKDRRYSGEWFDIEYEEIDDFIFKYNEMTDVTRIMFDIPIHVNLEHKNIKDLKCIKTFFDKLPLDICKINHDYLYKLLVNYSKLSYKQLKDVDYINLYNIYFKQQRCVKRHESMSSIGLNITQSTIYTSVVGLKT